MARQRTSLTSQGSLGPIVGLYGLHCFTSLAYQVVWMNLMAAEVGRTLSAIGLVMAVFTAGLGLGAAGLAWQAQRRVLSPRTCFALAQGLLGLWCSLSSVVRRSPPVASSLPCVSLPSTGTAASLTRWDV